MEERVAESVFVTVVHCPVAPAGISPEQAADWQPGWYCYESEYPEEGSFYCSVERPTADDLRKICPEYVEETPTNEEEHTFAQVIDVATMNQTFLAPPIEYAQVGRSQAVPAGATWLQIGDVVPLPVTLTDAPDLRPIESVSCAAHLKGPRLQTKSKFDRD